MNVKMTKIEPDNDDSTLEIEVAIDHMEIVNIPGSRYEALVTVARQHKLAFAKTQNPEVRARIEQDEEIYVDISTCYDGSFVTFRNI